jgi:hypothetical protein
VRISKEWGDLFPVLAPEFADEGVLFIPFFGKFFQGKFGLFLCLGLIDRLKNG